MTQRTPLNTLSHLAGEKGLSQLHIPTITEDAEDVIGLHGRIRLQKDNRTVMSSRWMDKQRDNLHAYEYLCHIGEAKEWIEECIQEDIGPIVQLEESLRNGIVVAKLASWFAPGSVRKIFCDKKLQFRHSDNINYFFDALQFVRLPKIFWFELTDLYEKKNIPKVIYCIHALSHLLSRRHLAPDIKNLLGQLEFTDEEITATQRGLDIAGVSMPNFQGVQSSLRNELQDEDAEYDAHYNLQQLELNDYFYRELLPEIATVPDLIIEEDSGSENSDHGLSEEQKMEIYWSDEYHLSLLMRCQAMLRTRVARRHYLSLQKRLHSRSFMSTLVNIQAHSRGMLARRQLSDRIAQYNNQLAWILKLQTQARGYICRAKYKQLMQYYASHEAQIIIVQRCVRDKLARNAYHRLTHDRNPSLGTVKTFVHLLDDSELDFDRELILEDLRQEIVQYIRHNNQLDAHVNTLDLQIGLFLKNAISIDEVLKHCGAFKKKKEQQRRIHQLADQNNYTSPLSLNGIDKSTCQRRKSYEKLIYVLQTEPKYLARLLSMTSRQDVGDHVSYKLIESTVLTLFGYATNAREEFLLLNVCKKCIEEEMKTVQDTNEFLRGNYTFLKLMVQINRGAKERHFFQKLLGPLIHSVIDDEYLDLETDPVSIYHKVVNDEESRTGQPSMRKENVNSQEALADDEVREVFIHHLRNLREITEAFMSAITSTCDQMPYSIRAIARELREVLRITFPHEPQANVGRIIGNFIYYRYLNPAIIAPEQYDVIQAVIHPVQRRNLAEISKMLQAVSSGRLFTAQDMFLAPLNDYVAHATKQFNQWFMQLTDVESPEEYFNQHSLADQVRTEKPRVYISPTELFHLHYALQVNLRVLEPEGTGKLHGLLQELGDSPYMPNMEYPESTICLSLTNPSNDLPSDPAARIQQLQVDAKRLVIYVIKVQSGTHLQEIFEAPVTPDHEAAWTSFKKVEFSGPMGAKRQMLKLSQSETPLDLQNIKFFQLKSIAQKLVIHLERLDVIPQSRHHQEMINMIAQDITGKNRRRVQRDREISRIRLTLHHLEKKHQYLLVQGNQYEDYLMSCMTAMATKRGQKQRMVLPFSRQYFHLRGLQKQGMVPKFGSYKYTAKELYDRGVLVELSGIDRKHYDRISMVFSMDQAGIITIEGTYSGWSLSSLQVDVRYEELLQTQFEGIQYIQVLDDMAKANVNLLIYLINKKFYA